MSATETTSDQRRPGPDDLWVRSDISAEGAYIVTINAGPDVVFPLTPDEARRYTSYVAAQVARAEYDAAVLAQMVDLDLEMPAVAELIKALRADRPPLTSEWPVALEPLVSGRTHKPYVHLHVNGAPVGQIGTAAVIEHVTHVLEIVHGVDLDAAYHRHLVAIVGLADERARAAVAMLERYRQRT